jgi:hypothetical protein
VMATAKAAAIVAIAAICKVLFNNFPSLRFRFFRGSIFCSALPRLGSVLLPSLLRCFRVRPGLRWRSPLQGIGRLCRRVRPSF